MIDCCWSGAAPSSDLGQPVAAEDAAAEEAIGKVATEAVAGDAGDEEGNGASTHAPLFGDFDISDEEFGEPEEFEDFGIGEDAEEEVDGADEAFDGGAEEADADAIDDGVGGAGDEEEDPADAAGLDEDRADDVACVDGAGADVEVRSTKQAEEEERNLAGAEFRDALDDLPLEAKAPLAKAPVAKASVAKAPVSKASVGKAPVAKAPVAKAPVSKAPVAKAPVAKAPVAMAPVAKAPVAKAPVARALVAQAFVPKGPVAKRPPDIAAAGGPPAVAKRPPGVGEAAVAKRPQVAGAVAVAKRPPGAGAVVVAKRPPGAGQQVGQPAVVKSAPGVRAPLGKQPASGGLVQRPAKAAGADLAKRPMPQGQSGGIAKQPPQVTRPASAGAGAEAAAAAMASKLANRWGGSRDSGGAGTGSDAGAGAGAGKSAGKAAGKGAGKVAGKGPGGDNARPRDWECPGCGANVFASKDSCFKCGEQRPAGGGGGGKSSHKGVGAARHTAEEQVVVSSWSEDRGGKSQPKGDGKNAKGKSQPKGDGKGKSQGKQKGKAFSGKGCVAGVDGKKAAACDTVTEAKQRLPKEVVARLAKQAHANAEQALSSMPDSESKQAKVKSVRIMNLARLIREHDANNGGGGVKRALEEGGEGAPGKRPKSAQDEVEYSDKHGRPFSLREIVVNFANVGASYGVKVLGREGTGLFDWDGVRKACRFLKNERGWKVTGVINENYTGSDQAQGGNNSIRLPQDIKQLCDGDVLETPRITTSNHSSADDEMTIKCAYRRNSRFLDNDNYRDWLTQLHDDKIREWLNTYQDLLHTRYFFDKSTGDFDLIEGNVPSHMLAQGIKNVDKKALWTMNR